MWLGSGFVCLYFLIAHGRVARMLAKVMGLQAGLQPLDFQDMITTDKEECS